MNEAETRAEHIDPALQAAGRGVVQGSRTGREYPITLSWGVRPGLRFSNRTQARIIWELSVRFPGSTASPTQSTTDLMAEDSQLSIAEPIPALTHFHHRPAYGSMRMASAPCS